LGLMCDLNSGLATAAQGATAANTFPRAAQRK
jgi:hypothetical protein